MSADHLFHYCERAGDATFWAEPLNAISNAAFVIAGIMALIQMRRMQHLQRHYADIVALAIILIAIGCGSFAWHVHPTDVTVMMDVIPITAFINMYLCVYLRRILAFRWWQIAAAIVALQLCNVAATIMLSPDTLYGTIMYIPTYLFLLWMATMSSRARCNIAYHIWLITALWTMSLVFRTIDIPSCQAIAIGTHYLWHLFNAAVLYKLLVILLRSKISS